MATRYIPHIYPPEPETTKNLPLINPSPNIYHTCGEDHMCWLAYISDTEDCGMFAIVVMACVSRAPFLIFATYFSGGSRNF